jgi:hypothetical protein
MTRSRLTAVVGYVVLALCSTTTDVCAAAFNVYYKPAAGDKWTFYAGKPDRAAAEATVNSTARVP